MQKRLNAIYRAILIYCNYDLMRSIETDSPLLRHARPQSEAERLPLWLQRVVHSIGLLQGIPERTAASLPFLSARSSGLFFQGLQISRLTGKGVNRSVTSAEYATSAIYHPDDV